MTRGRHLAPRMRRRFNAWGIPLTLAFLLVWAGVAWADNVQNDITGVGDRTITAGGSTTIAYTIQATGGNCDAADGSPATLTVNAPAEVSVTPASRVYTSCGTGQSFQFGSAVAGDYPITVSVSDSAGSYNTSPAAFQLRVNPASTPTNSPPEVDAGGPYSGDEGSAISITGTADDPDDDPLTYEWSYSAGVGVDAGATCSFDDASALSTTVTCTDDGTYSLTLTADDGVNDPESDSATLTVSNVAPVIGDSDVTVDPLTGDATASFDFTDAGSNDTHTATADWGGSTGSQNAVVTNGEATSSVTLDPGCYDLTVTGTVTDDDGGSDTETLFSGQVDVYALGFKAPIVDNERNIAKYGNVVPVKVTVTSSCTGSAVTDLVLHIRLVKGSGSEIITDESVVVESVSKADSGTQMRQVDGMYMYNLSTKSLTAGSDYTIQVREGSQSGDILLEAVLHPKK